MSPHLYPLRLWSTPDPTPAGVRELLAVREIAQSLLTAERAEDVFQFALDRVSPLVGASLGCVYLTETDSDVMYLAAAYNWPAQYARFLGEMRVRLGAGPSGKAAAERRTMEVADVLDDPDFADWRDVASELGFRSLVALPLQTGVVVHGAITFYFADPGSASAETQHLLRTVADQMAATAQKARLIEDLRQANRALTASNEELERQFVALLDARRVKDEFLANISHELRTPLTAVIGYISLMQEGIAGPVTDDQQDTLAQVRDSSEQLLSLIADLLDLTTLKRGRLEASPSEFLPHRPLRDGVAAASGRADGVGLEIVDAVPEVVMWNDREKATKIVAILVGNAFKFTHEGQVRVRLQIAADRAVYLVEDSGIGIAADALQFIFDEFRQVDGTATRRYSGSGLGLSLARRLARLLGGDVSVVSSPGVGSTFRLDLPLTFDGEALDTPIVGELPDQNDGTTRGATS